MLCLMSIVSETHFRKKQLSKNKSIELSLCESQIRKRKISFKGWGEKWKRGNYHHSAGIGIETGTSF